LVTREAAPGASGFAGSLSIIAGGNQGIGAGIAARLFELGSNVVLLGRNEDTLSRTAESIRSSSTGSAWVETRRIDVRDLDGLQDGMDRLIAEFGAPRLLVNSAGNSLKKPALEVTPEEWSTTIDTHLRGTFFACQAVARAMSARGYGKIVNLSSTWATTVAPERSVYAIAKAGVGHLTAALAVEWAPLGIRVNAVAPTATYTPRVLLRHQEDPAAVRYSAERIPLGKLAEVRDVVEAALYLASDAADFVTGHTLYVDGGWRFAK
jgi:NAD(P)-dependent dehydrogenase (short-subunit alcohol dehydrogenase family)